MVTAKKATADNNKRLAMLEAGVSSLSIALATNGIVAKDEAYDVFAVTTAAIKRSAEIADRLMALIAATTCVIARFAPDMELAPKDENEALIDVQIRLLEQLATAETPCDREIAELKATIAAGPDTPEGGDQALIAAAERAAKAEAMVSELTAEIEELRKDIEDVVSAKNAIANELADLKAGNPSPATADDELDDAADETAAVDVRDTPRDIGPTFGQSSAEEIYGLLQEGAVFELALSDGNSELLAFSTIQLSSRDMQRHGDRYLVVPAIHAKLESGSILGPQEIGGAGLLLNGEQIAYCPLEQPQRVAPGEERAFRSTFSFG